MRLSNEEMLEVKGGSISANLFGIIGVVVAGAITFLVGVIEGYVEPNACRRN